MSVLKKIGKYFLRFLLFILLLLVLIAAILQIPAVQNYVADKATAYLKETLKTEVRLESIHLRLPESLVVTGFYMEDLERDTFISVGELSVNFTLNKLLQKQIQFDEVTLKNGVANIDIDENNVANFDFITEAFAPTDSSKVELPEPTPDKPTASPWELTFNNTGLKIENVRVKYDDNYGAIDFRGNIGELSGGTEDIDLAKGIFNIDDLNLRNSDISLEMGESLSTDTTSTVLDYTITGGQLNIENVNFAMKMATMEVTTYLQNVEADELEAILKGDDIGFKTSDFLIENSDLAYNVPNAPVLESGFDVNHFDFKNINVEIADLDYLNMDIVANIQRLHLEDSKGFVLHNATADFTFNENELLLQDFLLDTKNSLVKSEKTEIQFPFLAENPDLNELMANVNINIEKLAIADMQYFYPDLYSIDFFRKNKGKLLTAKAIGQGAMEEFTLETFELDNWNTKIKANGLVRNPLDTVNAYFDLDISRFRVTDRGISDWLPPNTLPEYVTLPNVLNFVGKFKGKISDFNARLNGQTTRFLAPVASELEISGRFKNIMNIDRAFFDIRLDSLYTTKEDFMAYLPPGTIPEYVDLPNQLLLRGTAKGTTQNMVSDFKLSSVRNGKVSDFLASGSLSDLLSGKIGFDIALESAEFTQADILAFLPDSLLPAYFKLPFINKITGIIKGNTENFKSKLSFNANGNWTAEAALDGEKYDVNLDVDNLDLEAFFENNYLDTLVGFTPAPWKVELAIKGTGFDPYNDMNADLRMQVKRAGQDTLQGLVVNGKLQQEKLTATATAKEADFNLDSELSVDFTTNIPKIKYDLELSELDLQALGLSEVPFKIRTEMYANIEGYTLDTLSGTVKFRNLDVLFDSTFQQIDSIEIAAKLDNGNNLVDVTSDVFDAHLEGYFKYPEIMDIGSNYFKNYFKTATSDTLISREKANFDFIFDLHRPELLTSGLVDNLNGLSPFVMTASFDNENDKLQLNANLTYLNYMDFLLDSLKVGIDAKRDFLDYGFSFKNAEYQDIVDVVNFRMYGKFQDAVLNNNLEILDKSSKKRFALRFAIEALGNQSLGLKLDESQLLNYEKWQVTTGNYLQFGGKTIKVDDWKFFKGQQNIQISNEGENGLKLAFNRFDLEFISKIIQTDGGLLDGNLNGAVMLRELTQTPVVDADIRIDSLKVMQAALGNLKVIADNETKGQIAADLTLKGQGNDLQLKGYYDLNNTLEALNLKLDVNALSLASIEPLTFGALENATGIFQGNVDITGSLDQPSLMGKTNFTDAAFDVGMLKTRLKIGTEPIIFDANAIEFENLKVYDTNNNEGTISSYLLTPNYREFFLRADVHVEDFQVLDTKAGDNDLYYGKMIVDADVSLRGSLAEPEIEVTVSPNKNSDLTYVYTANSNSLVSHEGVVEFVVPFDAEDTRTRKIADELIPGASELNMKVVVRASIDDNLKFTAIVDPITGDNFTGQAEGDVVFTMNPDGSMEMTGKLAVISGTYLFTYQNVVRRPFKVKPGSTITWLGPVENPKLDVTILYDVVASPLPLLSAANPDAADNPNLSKRQEFQVKLNVTGNVNSTNISTSIAYPDGESGGNTEVTSAINRINADPSQSNTQAFALILFNGFIAPNIGDSDFQLLGAQSSLNDVITQQLNTIANKYIKFVELDFGLEEGANENTDFRVSIRKRFLNDRLTISVDGKTSTTQEANSSQTFLDNITIDYSLTPNGRYKVKIYNQQEVNELSGVANVKVGGAFVFSKDFNGVRIFNKKEK